MVHRHSNPEVRLLAARQSNLWQCGSCAETLWFKSEKPQFRLHTSHIQSTNDHETVIAMVHYVMSKGTMTVFPTKCTWFSETKLVSITIQKSSMEMNISKILQGCCFLLLLCACFDSNHWTLWSFQRFPWCCYEKFWQILQSSDEQQEDLCNSKYWICSCTSHIRASGLCIFLLS